MRAAIALFVFTAPVLAQRGYVWPQSAAPGGLVAAPIPVVQLGELGAFRAGTVEGTIYHKDLRRVAYVFADTAGRPPGEAILDVIADEIVVRYCVPNQD